jgi:hypothetical protein
MSFIEDLEDLALAVDPAGLAMYATVMAFLLGTVAVARFRDEAVGARKASSKSKTIPSPRLVR